DYYLPSTSCISNLLIANLLTTVPLHKDLDNIREKTMMMIDTSNGPSDTWNKFCHGPKLLGYSLRQDNEEKSVATLRINSLMQYPIETKKQLLMATYLVVTDGMSMLL
ncbi:hypothetical protein J0S82_012737, partial [Galemys pyrenaicus]